MRKLIFILSLLIISISGFSQGIKRDSIIGVVKVQADSLFIWQGDSIQKDSLAYLEWTENEVRFKRIQGTFTDWFSINLFEENYGMILPLSPLAISELLLLPDGFYTVMNVDITSDSNYGDTVGFKMTIDGDALIKAYKISDGADGSVTKRVEIDSLYVNGVKVTGGSYQDSITKHSGWYYSLRDTVRNEMDSTVNHTVRYYGILDSLIIHHNNYYSLRDSVRSEMDSTTVHTTWYYSLRDSVRNNMDSITDHSGRIVTLEAENSLFELNDFSQINPLYPLSISNFNVLPDHGMNLLNMNVTSDSDYGQKMAWGFGVDGEPVLISGAYSDGADGTYGLFTELTGTLDVDGEITADNLSGTNTGDLPIGGANREIQYNNSGAFGGMTGFEHDGTHIEVDEGNYLKFLNSSDATRMQFYVHGTGSGRISSPAGIVLFVTGTTDQTWAQFSASEQKFYSGGSEKFATESTGVQVTGILEVTTDIKPGGDLYMDDDKNVYLGSGGATDSRLYFDGTFAKFTWGSSEATGVSLGSNAVLFAQGEDHSISVDATDVEIFGGIPFVINNSGAIATFTVTGSSGNTVTSGYVDAATGFKDNGTAGIDDSWTNNEGDVVTVSGGIITDISPPPMPVPAALGIPDKTMYEYGIIILSIGCILLGFAVSRNNKRIKLMNERIDKLEKQSTGRLLK
jgi:hypothetical protein